MSDADAAREMIEAVYNDGKAEINSREYVFTKMIHRDRRKVFAYMTSVQHMIQAKNFAFMDSAEFESVEKVIMNSVTFENSLLSKLEVHWDAYPQDYLPFITTALPVISYPFLSANPTG